MDKEVYSHYLGGTMLFLQRVFAHPVVGQIPRPAVLVSLLILGTVFPNIPAQASVTLLVLAFIQNAAYSLQSRAANRTSNLYHFIAAVFSTSVFFVTLSFLVHIKVTLDVLLVYILGTMLGSVYGTRLSVVLERLLGAVADLGGEAKNQSLPLWKAVLGLTLLLGLEFTLIRQYDVSAMALIALAAFVANALFASLRIARNTDAYWFHLVLAIIHGIAGFFVYKVLVEVRGDWYLFAPYLTGSVLGSLIGAEAGKRFGKFIKASWHAHDLAKDVVPLPILPALACLFLLVPHLLYFGFAHVWVQCILLCAAALQTSAFTVISRARQRNHELYIEWSSVFSNGVWFVTLNVLVVNDMAMYLIVPYLVGTGIGSLWGQAFAMSIEKHIGASMDAPKQKPSA